MGKPNTAIHVEITNGESEHYLEKGVLCRKQYFQCVKKSHIILNGTNCKTLFDNKDFRVINN